MLIAHGIVCDIGLEQLGRRLGKEVLEELQGFDRDALDEERRLTYDVLLDYLKTSREGSGFYDFQEPFSPIMGEQSNLPVVFAEYALRSEQDVTDYLALLEQVPDYISSLILLEEERAKKGLGMPDSSVDEVVSGIEEFLSSGEENIFLTSFTERLKDVEGLSNEKKQEYEEQNHELVTNEVLPAFQKIIRCLQDTRGSAENTEGLCYTENGAEYYEYLIRSMTGSPSGRASMNATISFPSSTSSISMSCRLFSVMPMISPRAFPAARMLVS